jgi:O-antigen/teichoic acid export membrane protein
MVLARTFGPTVNGEYTAITSWFGIALIVGGLGQPAALCFYIASDPLRARDYLATSRMMMLATGSIALIAGILLAPILSRGNPDVATGYRIAFAASIIDFVGTGYTSALQAKDLIRWNVVRIIQPAACVITIVMLWFFQVLTLWSSLIVLAATMTLQLAWAYRCCRLNRLVPGRFQTTLLRPLTVYGSAQIAALTPAVLNAQLDTLVLSQTVASASLGRYAIAVSLTLIPLPVVAAIGNVAFPRLAGRSAESEASRRLQRSAVIASAAIAAGMLLPLAAISPWMIPMVFGVGYRGAVPLIWLLTPGGIFFACGRVVADVLRGKNRPRVVAWSEGFAAVFTVILLFTLLPILGVTAAAIASTVSYGMALAVMLHFMRPGPGRHRRGRTRRVSPGYVAVMRRYMLLMTFSSLRGR